MPTIALGLHRLLFLLLSAPILLLVGAGGFAAWAQTPAPAPVEPATEAPLQVPAVPASAPTTVLVIATGPQWDDLGALQQHILQPLSATWNTLTAQHKSKWLAVAAAYPNKGPAEQEKIQSRMVIWAALTPAQRERARLNFASSKQLSASRAADWQTYQALSLKERQRLAAKVDATPKGAALAARPTSSARLVQVPITRRSTDAERRAFSDMPVLNPHTLLTRPAEHSDAGAAATPR